MQRLFRPFWKRPGTCCAAGYDLDRSRRPRDRSRATPRQDRRRCGTRREDRRDPAGDPGLRRRNPDARGKIVVPGLIDIHVHARDAELPPSEIPFHGVTTMVDGGSRGADNIGDMIAIAQRLPIACACCSTSRLWETTIPVTAANSSTASEPADVAKARAAVEQHRRVDRGTQSACVAVDRRRPG